MEEQPFQIVFKKLAELTERDPEAAEIARTAETLKGEAEEIAELRRLSAEMAEPPARFFTGT